MANGSYPARLGIEAPLDVRNWRPLVNWFLAIPHYLVLYALRILRQVLLLISFFTVLFTKQIPQQMFDLVVMTRRYGWRVGTYAVWMREAYPPFSFGSTGQDDRIDPAWLTVDYPRDLTRWGPLVKWLLAIPHYVVLLFLRIGAFFVILVSFFAVLFTGKWPEGMRSYVVGVSRWSLRVVTYVAFMTDEYPPFSLENGAPGGTPSVPMGGPPPQAPAGERLFQGEGGQAPPPPPPPESDRPIVPPAPPTPE
jgi:hypothetical protein